MFTAIAKKSIGDLGKRRSRTIFTILTIAFGVAALGMFGVVPLFGDAMENDIQTTNMWNVRASMHETQLNASDIQHIKSIDNVENAEFKQVFFTKIYVGERRNDALIVGMPDLENARVDRVDKNDGSFPGHMEIMTHSGNERYDVFNGGTGDTVTVMDSAGNDITLTISGSGRTLTYDHPTYGIAVFFTDMGTVSALSNTTGYNALSLDMEDTSKESMEGTTRIVERYLLENTDFVAFTDIPQMRQDGHWPGEDEFSDIASFFYVLTFMTLFCSIFLISNTMHTIITEQKKEIAQMKAVGATRLMIVRSYLNTSLIMGGIGSAIGAALGVLITFGMVWFLATSFYGMVPSFGIHLLTVILSVFAGILITLTATMPALIGAIRTNTREGLNDSGISASFGTSVIDKVLLRSSWLPRSARMGFRNVARKKGRSISTILQISLAVAMFLGVVSIGYSLTTAVKQEYDYFPFDIMITGQAQGGRPLTESMEFTLESLEGVQDVEPLLQSIGDIGGNEVYLMGYSAETTYDVDGTMGKGRWFTWDEQLSKDKVIVLGKAMSRVTGKGVGNIVTIDTATGPHDFEVIGINNGQMMNGKIVYMPLETLQDLLKLNDTVTGFVINTVSNDHDLIDSTSTLVEDTLISQGYVVYMEIWYVMKENNIRSNQNIVNLMIAVGSLIVFITTIGLMSTLTMNVIERTREIGMMRCLGSRSGHLRKVFGTEGLTMALAGGLLGIPFGYLTGLFLNWIMYEIMTLEMDLLFPIQFVLVAMFMTVILTLAIMQPPLIRAARFKPGEALRYQ